MQAGPGLLFSVWLFCKFPDVRSCCRCWLTGLACSQSLQTSSLFSPCLTGSGGGGGVSWVFVHPSKGGNGGNKRLQPCLVGFFLSLLLLKGLLISMRHRGEIDTGLVFPPCGIRGCGSSGDTAEPFPVGTNNVFSGNKAFTDTVEKESCCGSSGDLEEPVPVSANSAFLFLFLVREQSPY